MIRQYGAQRCRGGNNPLGVGVIAAGTIVYLQTDWWWRDRYRGKPVCRDPAIVESFLNGTMAAARRSKTGQWEDLYIAGRSDMAVVRSLRDGRRRQVAVRTLILHEDHGLTRQPCLYPTLPDMRFWRAQPRTRRGASPSCPTQPAQNTLPTQQQMPPSGSTSSKRSAATSTSSSRPQHSTAPAQ